MGFGNPMAALAIVERLVTPPGWQAPQKGEKL
uniref:Uncharacterized protein n=1 Tax=Cyanothece sp. (strain PCC 7425 / ATCC 29141) TaxID=395961 RepID=B8HX86_CYAP4